MCRLTRAGALASSAYILIWLVAGALPAQADAIVGDGAGLSTGHVLACDTVDEVEAVLNATDDDLSARLAAINARFGDQSCNIVTVIFYRGDEAKTVLVPDGIVRIVKVDVVGYRSGDAWMRMTKPLPQYVGVLEEATSV
jgi:hypothetical protein